MSNPFDNIAKNARETKNEAQWKGVKENAQTITRACDSCGAPRPAKSNLTTCSYCGFEFMKTDNSIEADI